MTTRRPLLRDVALLLLGAVTLALAAHVVTRPLAAPGRLAAASPAASPAVDVRPRALFVGSGPLVGVADEVSALLGWELQGAAPVMSTGYVAGAGQTFADRLPAALAAGGVDVVVLMSSDVAAEEADARVLGGRAQQVAAMVRAALPDAQVVLMGPLSVVPDAARVQRSVLTGVAARFGAFFVDPVGRRYVQGRPDLLPGIEALTPAGVDLVARRLAADLRAVLPAMVLPSPQAGR